jgi:hypothetical protein
MVKEILQGELGMRKFSGRWVAHSLSSPEEVALVAGSKDMLSILQESEENHFHGIPTGDKSWFQHLCSSSEMLAFSRSDIIPRRRQALRRKKPMITVFFTASKLIALDVWPKGRNFSQLFFLDRIFPDLKRAHIRSRRRNPG